MVRPLAGATAAGVRVEQSGLMELDRIDPSQGELPPALLPHFEGTARLQPLRSPFPDGPTVFAVHFEAGGRTRPHVHRSGQILHITGGEGVVADRSGRRVVRPGDVVTVMPGEWHWHGAGERSAMTHLTVQMPGPDETDWDVEELDWGAEGDDHGETSYQA